MKRPESKPSSWKQRWENWLVEGDAKKDTLAASDLAADAQWAASQQQAKGSRILLWSSLLCVLVLLIWASLGYIDEVVRGQGKVVPSRQVQVVQSLDGGVVEEILVRPGQLWMPDRSCCGWILRVPQLRSERTRPRPWR